MKNSFKYKLKKGLEFLILYPFIDGNNKTKLQSKLDVFISRVTK